MNSAAAESPKLRRKQPRKAGTYRAARRNELRTARKIGVASGQPSRLRFSWGKDYRGRPGYGFGTSRVKRAAAKSGS
jgi:hypothetical protein